MLPLQGALQTLLVTAGAAPEAQRSPQTTPPRELLTPEWGTEHIRRGHSRRLWGWGGVSQTRPPPRQGPAAGEGEGSDYLHTFTAPTPSHSLLRNEKRERSVPRACRGAHGAKVKGRTVPSSGALAEGKGWKTAPSGSWRHKVPCALPASLAQQPQICPAWLNLPVLQSI